MVARRVARADLTTDGSSDDTQWMICASDLFPFAPSVIGLCSAFLLSVVLLDPCFALLHLFFIPATTSFWACNIQSHSLSPYPQACAYIPSVPRNPTLTTHIHIIQYTPRMRRLSFAFTPLFYPVSHSLKLRAISICAPFFILRWFRSFCPNHICLLLPSLSYCLSFALFPLCSCFGH